MADHQPEAWGGEVRMPRWLRRVLRRPDPPPPTPEAEHERRKRASGDASVLENSNRAASGALIDFYNEGKRHKR